MQPFQEKNSRKNRAPVKNEQVRKAFGRFGLLLACGLGAGLLPKAPGTFGTLLGVLVEVALFWLLGPAWRYPGLLLAFGLACALSLALLPLASKHFASHDPKPFVLDEVAGYLLIPVVLANAHASVWRTTLGFCLFRAFDILKPFPIGWVDRTLKGPFGVLLDDLLAGLFAALAILALQDIL